MENKIFLNGTKKTKKQKKHTLTSNKLEKIKIAINEDIVTEILLRLPTKSIFKFKCVCRTWFKIITDSWFVNAYKSSNPALPVLQGFFHVRSNHELAFAPVNHPLVSPTLMSHLPLDLQGLSICSISSSNGFLLLCATDGRKIVYNPVTRRRLMIPKMKGNQEWYHALGLIIHENDNHVKAVFAYKLATDNTAMPLEILRLYLGNKTVGRDELPEQWREMLVKWQCRTKDIEFKVYCSKKNEWNRERLVSKFPRYVCFDPEQMTGISIGGDLYWVTLDGAVLNYDGENEAARLIGAPEAITAEGPRFYLKNLHCSAGGILVYCADNWIKREVVIWELSDKKTWVAMGRVRLGCPLQRILYVCHETKAVFVQMFELVKRYVVSEGKWNLICDVLHGDQATPYFTSPWPAALNGDELCHSSSSSSSSSSRYEKNIHEGSKDQCCEIMLHPQPLASQGYDPPLSNCGGDRLFISYNKS